MLTPPHDPGTPPRTPPDPPPDPASGRNDAHRRRRALVAAFLLPLLAVLAVVAGLMAFAVLAEPPEPSWTNGTR